MPPFELWGDLPPFVTLEDLELEAAAVEGPAEGPTVVWEGAFEVPVAAEEGFRPLGGMVKLCFGKFSWSY